LCGEDETSGMATTKAPLNGSRAPLNGARRKTRRVRPVERPASAKGRLYGGLSAGERRAERRERLLEAGLELFGTVGFQKTTIPMLCSASGVTARHFYEDFDSRETLLRVVYDRIAANVFEQVVGALRADDRGPRQRIRDSNDAYFRYLTSDPRLARIYAIEAVGLHPELEAHRRAKREAFVKKLTKAAQRVEDSSVDSRLLSAAIAGAAHDLLLEWVLAPRRPSVEKMIDTITNVWIRTLQLDREPALR
jgi:AcrR family transcriptional regulator